MSVSTRPLTLNYAGARNRMLQMSVIAAVGLAIAGPAGADINYFYNGPTGASTPGTWDNGTTAIWASPNSNSTPLTTWTSSTTSDAFFSGSSAISLNIGANVVANSLNFNQTGTITFNSGNPITINSIFNNVGGQTVNFLDSVQSSGQLVIHGVSGSTNSKGISFDANTNQINGGVLLTGGSVYFNVGNTANRFVVDQTHLGTLAPPFNSPTGFNGSTVQSAPILLTTISGTDSHGNAITPAITVDANHSTVGLASIHTNDYVLPNAVVLNPSNASNFYTALGAGSVADSGTVGAGPYPAYATINFAGQISGNGNVIISNDFYGGGGKGFTIFSNSNNNYTGKTIINNNGQNYLTFQVGAQNAIPVTSDLVFGANSYGQSIGANSISSKQVGATDLNGFDVTIKSLSSDLAANVPALGITAVNNHGINPNLTSGPHATDGANGTSTTSTLTIDSQGALNNTFFHGNIQDGNTFLSQSTSGAGVGSYPGNYTSNASSYFNSSANGIKLALNLASTNTGSLTLTASNGGIVPEYTYSGGTTVRGGSLYVNGPMTAAAGSSATQVLVTGQTALLGGTGSILPDVHIQGGATLAPGSAPAPLSSGSGSSFNTLPSTFNTGTLTVNNLTMDGGSALNFVINDGSVAAVAGTGYGTLAFTAGGSFTESASVSSANPIFVDPTGQFNGFANYKNATWNLGNFPAGSSLSNIVLDTRNGFSPLPPALLANGTFSVTNSGTTLSLVFTPSPTVTALQYSGPAAGNWNTVNTNAVWTDLVHGAGSTFYADPANVLFVTPTANTTVTIQPGGVTPASVIFNNAATSGSTAVAITVGGGSINGAAPLSLNGSGHVILAGANAYSGGTGISGGGTLETQINGALGSGNLSLYNGTWSTTTADQTYSLSIQTLGTAATSTTSTIQTGPLTGTASGNLTLNGNVAGGGTFTKAGTGTLIVNGNLTQASGLNVSAGKLVINGADAYGGTTSVAAGATIEYQTAPNALIPFSVASTLAGTLTFDNVTTVTFSPGTYSASGTINLVSSGSSIQGTGGVIGGSPVDIGNTINLNPNNSPNFIAYVGMAGSGNLFFVHGPITGNGDVSFGAGPGQGGGAFISLFGHSTYSGNTFLDTGGSAVLTLQTDNALPTTTELILGENAKGSGIFDLNGHSQTVNNIATDPLGGGIGGIQDSAGGGVLTVSGSTSAEFKALLAGIFTFNIALQNNAVLDLSYKGSNNGGISFGNVYGGQTNVTSGVLRFSNALALSPNQNLLLNGGVLEIHANGFGNFTNSLGSDVNQIQLAGGTSGFSAFGSVGAVFNLNGGGAVVWGSSFFQPSVLVLNQTTATNTLDFQNSLDLNGAARTVTVNSTLAGTAATISGTVLGTGSLIKTGPGTLILSAANTYNGGTILNNGSLVAANAAGSATGSGNVTLNGGTLSGTGTIGGSVVGGSTPHTINPGASSAPGTIGTLSIGGLSTSPNTTLAFDLASPSGGSDLLNVQGNVTLNGGNLAITFQTTTGAASLGYYKVIAYSGSLTGSTSNLVLPAISNNVLYTLDAARDPGFIDVHRGLIGDANDDGRVDLTDLNAVLNNLGATTSAWSRGNFDGAATIDLTDLNDVLNNLGVSIPTGADITVFAQRLLSAAPAATPEPTSLGILALGVGALIARRRKA